MNTKRWWIPVVLCLSVVACDTQHASYDTAAEAIADDFMDKGWMPEWTPRAAFDVREVHDLDTNVSSLAFALPAGTKVALPSDCHAIAYADTAPSAFDPRWWPGEDALERAYAHFECDSDVRPKRLFVAIRKDGRRVLQWRAYDS